MTRTGRQRLFSYQWPAQTYQLSVVVSLNHTVSNKKQLHRKGY